MQCIRPFKFAVSACVCVCWHVWPPGKRERASSALRRRSRGITGRNDGKIREHSLVHSHARLLLRTGKCVFVQSVCVCVCGCVQRVLPHQKAHSICLLLLIKSVCTHTDKEIKLSAHHKGNFHFFSPFFCVFVNKQSGSTANTNLCWHNTSSGTPLSTWKDDEDFKGENLPTLTHTFKAFELSKHKWAAL